MSLTETQSNPAKYARLVRYAVAGGLSTLSHLGTMSALTYAFKVAPLIASSTGFALSIVVSYTLQRFWVFRDSNAGNSSAVKFLVVTGMAFCINLGVMWIGTSALRLEPIIPQAIAVVIIPIFNYIVNRAWTFKRSN